MRDRLLDRGQCLEAEEVELHKARLLHPFHVELGDRHIRTRIAVERRELRQRPVADHDAGGMGRCVPVQTFKLQRDVEHAPDPLVLGARRVEARLVLDRLRERHGIGRVLRHELAELVDLSVRHFENTPDVAHHAARLQRAEGDDLRHVVLAVFLLDVADHLLAPLLAEVDVEVRHRDAVGIEEALEQKTEADRVEVGDRQRPGDKRARARAAARPDGNSLPLRPFDEVGDDQEVAGKLHAFDDADFEIEPRGILLFADVRRAAVHEEPFLQPLNRLTAQFRALIAVARVARQDRLGDARAERAAPRDLDRVLHRFRQVRKQRDHFRARLETMLDRHLPPLAVGDEPPFGDRQQRVMRLVIAARREIALIGRNQRQVLRVGERHQPPLGIAFAIEAVTLKLDVKPVAEHMLQAQQARRRKIVAAVGDGFIERPAGSAGEADQARAVRRQIIERNEGVGGIGLEKARARQRQKIAVTLLRSREENEPGPHGGAGSGAGRRLAVRKLDRDGCADNRLQTALGEFLGKLQRPEQIGRVGQRKRRLLVGLGQFGELLDRQRALEQRERRMDVEMDETYSTHAPALSFAPARPAARRPTSGPWR